MKILFCGLKYEYGRLHLGLSAIEYNTFYESLKLMPGVEVDFFGLDEKILEVGRGAVDALLISTIEQTKPDLLFCLLFTDELKKETIAYITKKTSTKTFNWFADDHWRFPVYSKYWAPLFTRVSTTDSKAVAKYKAIGIDVIKTQWAANTLLYKPSPPKVESGKLKVSDISFVGKNYGNRGEYIADLKSAGLPAEGYGGGWPSGRVDFNTMLEIFSSSKINLNFTESPYMTAQDRAKIFAKLFVKKTSDGYKLNAQHFFSNLQSAIGSQRRQIKGRNFEVPACGGFLLTGDADNIADYYIPGKEITIFNTKEELVEKSKYYLAHEAERSAIAKAGYERTLKEHTYEQRFKAIFQAIGF